MILLCCFFGTALTILFIRNHQLQNIMKWHDDKMKEQIKDMKKHIDECEHASFSPCSDRRDTCIDHPDGYECKCRPGMYQSIGVRWFFRRTHAHRTLRFLPTRTLHAHVLFACFPTAPALAPTHIQCVSCFIRLNKRAFFDLIYSKINGPPIFVVIFLYVTQ